MKIFHISDLHIGKMLHMYNLGEQQSAVLHLIVQKVQEYQPEVLLIAGDIFDKAVPSAEAYSLLNNFLKELADVRPRVTVCMIAGNHDSAARLQYASSFLEQNQIYISVMPPQEETEYLKRIDLEDEYGPVHIYLLPFTKPAYVRKLFAEGTVTGYDSAVREVIGREQICLSDRNVLAAHQFFVNGGEEPEKRDSELAYISVGGIDSVDIACIRRFDYAALGHIHTQQRIGCDHIRYSGTPMKYSVSEAGDQKSITMVTLREKGTLPELEMIPLETHPDIVSLRGTFEEMMKPEKECFRDDYVSITLTDEESIYRPKERLQEHYHNILEVLVDNKRTRALMSEELSSGKELRPMEAFEQFYQEMNGEPASDGELKLMKEIYESALAKYNGQENNNMS